MEYTVFKCKDGRTKMMGVVEAKTREEAVELAYEEYGIKEENLALKSAEDTAKAKAKTAKPKKDAKATKEKDTAELAEKLRKDTAKNKASKKAEPEVVKETKPAKKAKAEKPVKEAKAAPKAEVKTANGITPKQAAKLEALPKLVTKWDEPKKGTEPKITSKLNKETGMLDVKTVTETKKGTIRKRTLEIGKAGGIQGIGKRPTGKEEHLFTGDHMVGLFVFKETKAKA